MARSKEQLYSVRADYSGVANNRQRVASAAPPAPSWRRHWTLTVEHVSCQNLQCVWDCWHSAGYGRIVFTCCQYSSRDGNAEKNPVSCTIWSSWKMLHIGITSISLPGTLQWAQGKSAREELGVDKRRGQTGVWAVGACMRVFLRILQRLFVACDAPKDLKTKLPKKSDSLL